MRRPAGPLGRGACAGHQAVNAVAGAGLAGHSSLLLCSLILCRRHRCRLWRLCLLVGLRSRRRLAGRLLLLLLQLLVGWLHRWEGPAANAFAAAAALAAAVGGGR